MLYFLPPMVVLAQQPVLQEQTLFPQQGMNEWH
jgi:hypothetical protein